MHSVLINEITKDFSDCWQAAGRHIQKQVQDSVVYWIRADLCPPFLEHLSFRLGNQLFFIRLEDVDKKLKMPGSHEGLLYIADGCKGHPCILPMKKSGNEWQAYVKNGWGLLDVVTGKEINPFNLVDERPINMTDWELHDMAVQIVREDLEKEGFKIMSWHGSPHVDPSLWFLGENGNPEWVVIRHALYPEKQAKKPMNIDEIAKNCATLGKIGYFASVAIANDDDSSKPPCRGHGMNVGYAGLETYSSQ